MNKIAWVLVFFLLTNVMQAQTLMPVDAQSKVVFTIKNMGMNVDGVLSGVKGKLVFNPRKLSASSFDVTVDVNTINTDNEKRDKHLKTDDFFDAAQYPVIRIASTTIVSKGGNKYKAIAMLSIKKITKKIGFDFVAVPITGGYQFTGSFVINRREFDVGGSSMTMGDNVTVNLNVQANKQ
ncbi:MAG: YceI family protein [Niabella sp.]